MKTKDLILVALFAALTAAGGWIKIPLPFSPVPVTLQVFFVILSGVVLGSVLGGLSQVVYVALGAFGLPVFAGGTGGFGALVGPTGGYLVGFIVAAFVIGKLVELKGEESESSIVWGLFSMIVGIIVIYLIGFVQLSVVAKLSLQKAFMVGVLPFIAVDLLKAIVASIVAVKLKAAGVVE